MGSEIHDVRSFWAKACFFPLASIQANAMVNPLDSPKSSQYSKNSKHAQYTENARILVVLIWVVRVRRNNLSRKLAKSFD